MLFRKEAVENQLDKLHGDVVIVPKVSVAIITLVLVIWVFLAGVWLYSANYARKETVLGWLEPSNGIHRVFADKNAGTIEKVNIEVGQKVKRGDELFVISNIKALESGQELEFELLGEYKAQQQALSQRITREKQINTLEIQQNNLRVKNLVQEIHQADMQITILTEMLAVVKQREANYKTLQTTGYVPKDQYMSVKEQKLSIQSEYQTAVRGQLTLKHSLSELMYQQKILPQQHKNEITQLERQLSELNQHILQLTGQQKYVVKAKVDGVIGNLQMQQGDVVSSQDLLATINPLDGVFIANMLIPVRAAGFLQPDQSLKIRYDAFPYQKFGLFDGKITTISQSIILPNEVMHAHIAVQEPVYLVQAQIKQNNIHAYNQQIALKSGMTLSADVVLDNRNLFEWLLEPIFSVQGRL
ncbi:HlyD family efflux transporter periplasmic adaptor subunit [Gayadomonas joobiniege]|uniref:HlyD family efflux transporter periplasmic adaptor subunit n=1 Tax=Gayadomonas joobiniege TaxID=1234606 RepID=UPI00037B4E2E|nr:HlyD family efflux transporter periplasmic adaptor subunit [Gayadomonas joobiniege]